MIEIINNSVINKVYQWLSDSALCTLISVKELMCINCVKLTGDSHLMGKDWTLNNRTLRMESKEEKGKKACTATINQSNVMEGNSKILNTLQTRQVDRQVIRRTWTKRWLQMSIESECRWERGWGRGHTQVSRTYLKCQSKSEAGNLWRCCYGHPKVAKSSHGANILIDSLCLKQIAGLTKSWSTILEMRCRRKWERTKERGYSEAERCFVGVASGSGSACAGERAYVYARLFTT